mmetsp:Transcript_49881/g.131265  ORF Transcript_49881/g.131265 Transcript_49881/m.131265 type:complete len:146 (-) Transcript_49881:2439-2876(-)
MSTHVRQGSLVDSHSMNHSQNQLKSEQASDSPIARSFDYVGIFGSVIESGIFQKVNITEIALARSVAQIKLIPSVARLIDDFKTAGLAATVGFSPTNETLSFSLTVQVILIHFHFILDFQFFVIDRLNISAFLLLKARSLSCDQC